MSTATEPASQFDIAEERGGIGQAARDYWNRVRGADMGAAILATTLTERGWAWPLSLLAALATGVLIGFAIALLVARLGIPSFVVTLAFFLALQGAMLLIIGEGGTIPIRDDAVLSVMNDNMPVVLGWLFALIVIGGFAAATMMRIRARKREGLPTEAMSV